MEIDSDSRYKELFHYSPCGHLIVSLDNHILEVNQTLLNWLGYEDAKELEGRLFQEILSLPDKIFYETHFYPLILIQKHIKEINFQLVKKDKSFLPTLIDGRVREGAESCFILSVMDITHRKSYENELKKSKAMYEEIAIQLEKTLKEVNKEIEKSESLQKYMLPKSVQVAEKSFSVEVMFKPLDRVSGDIYDFFQLDENTYRFFLADATGHGLSAGFQTMSIHTEYQRIKKFMSIEHILGFLNEGSFEIFQTTSMMYSCVILDINLKKNTIEYVSAGHPDQIIYENRSFKFLKRTTPILGVVPSISARPLSISVQRPFSVLLFSDGIEELYNSELDQFGKEGVMASFQKYKECRDSNFFEILMEDAHKFLRGNPVRDDITLILIEGGSL